ncbi:hypothetical protein GDO78_012723 [Eleutherodactylus coqui]|uniref:Uncharacterized protein n=1 Tax=Eleutherodactylus coqui TaxID=57060 RepID=A0A8J6K4S2_ELECQ|nr:hypothetical protein GDO78_012723 [Eleutherodactylus coqui]
MGLTPPVCDWLLAIVSFLRLTGPAFFSCTDCSRRRSSHAFTVPDAPFFCRYRICCWLGCHLRCLGADCCDSPWRPFHAVVSTPH